MVLSMFWVVADAVSEPAIRFPQTITFPALADREYGSDSMFLDATASSGLPITFELVAGPATLVGNQLTLTGIGIVRIRASQAGDDTYYAAPSEERYFTVSIASANLSLVGLEQTYDGTPREVSASTIPAGLAVTTTYDGSLTPPVNVGTYALNVSITDPRYQGSVTGTLQVTKAPASLSFGPLPEVPFRNRAFVLGATSDSPATVTFSVLSGPATLSDTPPSSAYTDPYGSPITTIDPTVIGPTGGAAANTFPLLNEHLTLTGTGMVVLRASQAEDPNHDGATIDATCTITPAVLDPDWFAPEFVVRLADRTVGHGAYVTINASFIGNPLPTVQWQRRAGGNGDWIDLAEEFPYVGVNDASFHINAATVTMNGDQFRCILTNASGIAVGSEMTLTVQPGPPYLWASPGDQAALPGTTVVLSVNASGTPPLSYQWYKDDVKLPGATDSTLELVDVQAANGGQYRVRISNGVGSIYSATARLDVILPPQITAQPTGSARIVGETVALSAGVSSKGPTSYQWQHDGVPVAGATSLTLSLQNLQATDAGEYRLEVTNSAGSVTSQMARLTVQPMPAPQFYTSAQVSARLGDTLTLSPSVYGTGPYIYQWFREGVIMPGAISSTLVVPNVQLADLTEYVLAATNAAGTTLSKTFRVELLHGDSVPAHHWADVQRVGDVVYFLFRDPARLARYDLASQTWLPSWLLEASPVALAVAADAVYVGYANAVVRYSGTLTDPVTLFTTAGQILGTGLVGEILVVTTTGSWSGDTVYQTLDRTTGQVLAQRNGTYSINSNMSYGSSPGKFYGRTNATSSGGIRRFDINPDGTMGFEVSNTDGEFVTYGRIIPLEGGQLVAEMSGAIRSSENLAAVGNLGFMTDDVMTSPGGGYLSLRHGRVTEFDSAYRELRSASLGVRAERFFIHSGNAYAFAQPAVPGAEPSVHALALAGMAPRTVANTVDPRGLAIVGPKFETDGNDTVFIYSKLHRNVFRWSVEQWDYLPSIGLPNMPDLFVISPPSSEIIYNAGTHQIFRQSADGSGGPGAFVNSPGEVLGLQQAGAFTLISSWNDSFNPSFTHIVNDSQGRPVSKTANQAYNSPFWEWSPAKKRMYYFRDRVSPSDLLYEHIDPSGQVDFVPTDSPYHSDEPGFYGPLKASPDGEQITTGGGSIFETESMTIVGRLPYPIDDIAWSDTRLHTLRRTFEGSELETWSTNGQIRTHSVALPGPPLRLLKIRGDRLLAITSIEGVPTYHLFGANALEPIDATDLEAPPVITGQSESTTVEVGRPLAFWVTTSGGSLPDYQWQVRFAGSTVWQNVSDNEFINGARTARLEIARVPAAYAGARFRIEVVNTGGGVTREVAGVGVMGPAAIVDMAAGRQHLMFLRADGTLWSLGDNSSAQLGDGTRDLRTTAAQIGEDVVAVWAGHANAALLKLDNTLWGTGTIGNWYQAGPESMAFLPRQIAITGGAVSFGDGHALFLHPDGSLWGAGQSIDGQLGIWSLDSVPSRRMALGVKSASAGANHSVWLQVDGTLWGTGRNNYGQLGAGMPEEVYVPQVIATEVASVSAGDGFTLFIKTDGSLWGLGQNNDYELGDGTNVNRSSPVPIAVGVKQAVAGYYHSLFQKLDGTVWAMGLNTLGQLGDGTQQTRSTPVQVATEAVKLAAGSSFSALVRSDGSLWLVGRVYDSGFSNLHTWTKVADGLILPADGLPLVEASDGTLSYGVALAWSPVIGATGYEVWRGLSSDPMTASLLLATGPAPIAIDGTAQGGITYHYWVRAVHLSGHTEFGPGDTGSRGTAHLPVITLQPVGGTIYGQTTLTVAASGDPLPTYQWEEIQPGGTEWTPIADSWPNTGVATDKLRIYSFNPERSGTQIRCVVSNAAGSVISSSAVLESAAAPPTFTQHPANLTVAAGAPASLQVFAYDLVAPTYQWFKDGAAIPGATSQYLNFALVQAGDAGTYALTITDVGGVVTSQTGSITVVPSSAVSAVAAGDEYTLFTQANGAVRGMGANQYNQTGVVSYSDPRIIPVPYQEMRDPGFYAVAAGLAHSLFLQPAWISALGRNDFGQALTNGGPGSGGLLATAGAAVGNNHSLILKQDGTVWAVGRNDAGQLGDGTMTDRNPAVQVMAGVRAIAAGGNSSYFIRDDASLWSVGDNADGQLGDGTLTTRLEPIQVATGVARVAASASFAVFIKQDGTLWGMGLNVDGQLGVPGEILSRAQSPLQIATDVVHASAGGGHLVFLKSDGSLWGMGRNDLGQLGAGDTLVHAGPVQIATGVTRIAAGGAHTCYVDDSGALWVVGSNASRQLGLDTAGSFIATPVRLWAAVVAVPARPANLNASFNTVAGGVHLWWDGVPGAHSYEVWRHHNADPAGAVRLAQGVENPLYHDGSALAGVVHYYWVKAINNAGASSFSTVNAGIHSIPDGLPVITSHPESRTLSLDSAHTFHVATTSSTPVTYTWRKNGVPIPDAVFTSGYFTPFSRATMVDAGGYDVIVSNSAGSVTSRIGLLTISKGYQSISFNAPSSRPFDPVPIPLTASASPSNLPVTLEVVSGPAMLSGSTLTLTGVGRVTLRASQNGNESYDAASEVWRSFDVTMATLDLEFIGLQSYYDGAPKPVAIAGVPAGLSTKVTYDGSLVPPSGVGTYNVLAVVLDEYFQGTKVGLLTIAPGLQNIAFVAPARIPLQTGTLALEATASSGLPVTFFILSGPASLSGDSLIVQGPGTVIVRAVQAGDANYDPAPAVDRYIEIMTAYGSWGAEYFSPQELAESSVSGPLADPDGDGFPNLVEYALGLQPKVGTTLGVPEVSTDATDWIYTYTKPIERSDLTYAVEVSTDLTTWGTPAVAPELTATVDGIETWRARQPLSFGNVFFRLKVVAQ